MFTGGVKIFNRLKLTEGGFGESSDLLLCLKSLCNNSRLIDVQTSWKEMCNCTKHPYQRGLSSNLPSCDDTTIHVASNTVNIPGWLRGASSIPQWRLPLIPHLHFSSPLFLLLLKCWNSEKCSKQMVSAGRPWWPVRSGIFLELWSSLRVLLSSRCLL